MHEPAGAEPGGGCPDREALRAFGVGDLPGGLLEQVAAHLGGCARCVQALEGLDPGSDPLLAQLRRPPPTEALPGAGGQTETGPARPPAAEPDDALVGRSVGPYLVEGRLGRGGMGSVYRAVRAGAYRQRVALKVVRAGLEGADALRRFRAERQALADLEHAHVARLLDGGTLEDGRPYFVMEYIDGEPLDRYCDRRQLGTRERVELLRGVCAAVQHAHERGVVHRDLKPANVLVTAEGCPKVTDFGLAKRLPTDPAEASPTQSGAVLGTPSYMAPEQAGGKRAEVGAAADVYALGAILYELLTGRPPFRADTPLDTLLQVLSEEPVPPGRLHPHLPRDLETICLKCLQKDPARRYPSVAALAEDLRRFLAGEPTQARPVPAWERALKWVRRRPAVAGLVAVGGVALLAAVALVTGAFYNARLHEEKERAEAAQRQAEMYQYFHHVALAHAGWRDGNLVRMEPLLDACPPDQRRLEWYYLKRLCHADLFTFEGHADWVHGVAFSPDGTRLASASRDRTVKLWDAASGQVLHTLRGHSGDVWGVAFSPDGARLATAGEDGTVKLWDARTGREVRTCTGHTNWVRGVAFSPDGARLASASHDGTARVWDAATGRAVHVLKGHGHWVARVAFSPDGARLASASHDGTVKVWDMASGREVLTLRGHAGAVEGLAFSPDGARIASAGADRSVRLWDATAGRATLTLRGHSGPVLSVTFSPDGARLASAGADQAVWVWDATTGRAVHALKGHTNAVGGVAFSPDGARLASASRDRTVKLWAPLLTPEARTLRGHTGAVEGLTFSPGASRLATGGADGTVRVWDARTGQEVRLLRGHAGRVRGVAFSPDGARLATGGADGAVKVWDASPGREGEVASPLLTLKGHLGEVLGVAFSPDGARLASGGADGTVRVWDARTGQEVRALQGHTDGVPGVAFSPDGARLASASFDGTLKLWDVATGQAVFNLRGHAGAVWGVAFSPDGARLASANRDATVIVWNAATGEATRTLRGHNLQVISLGFSPDGARLASASWDQTVKVWDMTTGEETLTLRAHTDWALGVAFSPDGARLASGGADGTVRVWDARPLTPESAAEREALGLLEFLFARPLCKVDVLQYLQSSPTITPEARRQALALVGRYREATDPERFRRGAWAVARQPYLNAFQYRFALRQAETACRLAPEQAEYRTTLGVAQYRAVQDAAAVVTLTRADQLNQGVPSNLAFLALAQHRLGREEDARATLARLRKAVQGPAWADKEEARVFLGEAESTLRRPGRAPDKRDPHPPGAGRAGEKRTFGPFSSCRHRRGGRRPAGLRAPNCRAQAAGDPRTLGARETLP